MQRLFKKHPIGTSASLGFITFSPFIILESVNRQKFQETFPFSLFIFGWALQSTFIFFVLQTIQMTRYDKSFKDNPMGLFLRVVGMGFILYIWGGWIIDQWPCLMGVPNCD